ncbi:MAG: AAA family ATPase, partial [Planctomycetes bacterium]|nr:AAA family ATPase [Planctomycetota bacterium]
MKPYPLSVHTFEKLIQDGCLYVDKTAQIHRLVSGPGGAFFLSRPRRFGKSLLLSTLKAIFLGKRELFRGLAIEKLAYEWKAHPVIHLDLGDRQGSSAALLERLLTEAVDDSAAGHGVGLSREGAASRFRELIGKLAARGKVVVLIDEYDKPILGNIENTAVVREIQALLKGFYSVLKSADEHLRFAFLTGVSKFSKVSVFSDLNNLIDLSMDPAYADLLGCTEEELETYFGEALRALAAREGQRYEEVLEKVRGWYNGYRFSEAPGRVYNPVSLMSLLAQGKFKNYWFETGTPKFLIDLLKRGQLSLAELPALAVSERVFSAYDVERVEALPLLYQTGYLTIQHYDPMSMTYRLDFPNQEVSRSFSECLAESYSGIGQGMVESHLQRIRRALDSGDVDGAMEALKVFFANIPYDIQLSNERYYQTIFYVVFLLLGQRIAAEERTSAGRIDAVLETPGRVYVLEFKLRGTAEEALAQIRERKY